VKEKNKDSSSSNSNNINMHVTHDTAKRVNRRAHREPIRQARHTPLDSGRDIIAHTTEDTAASLTVAQS
jgi:hypothetical protein